MKKSSDSSGSMVVRRLAILAAACLAWSLLGAASLWAQRPLTEKHVRELGKYLDGVQIAEPIAYRQLSVYPILVEDEPLLRGRWLTLDKAISRGILEVGEKAGGSVPVVRVRNKSRDENVLIMTGEVVAGGMQTRTIRHDVVLAPRQTIDLDVFCVEAHRWSGEEKFSGGSKVMLPQSIQGKVREGADQGKVWSEVARNNSSLRAENSTGSLEKALNSGHVRRRLEEARRKIVPEIPSGTVGFIFVGNGRALGAELFGSEDLARELLPKLLDSYVVDYVILRDSNSGRGKSDNRAAIDFFELLCRSGSQRATTAGSGSGISTRQGDLLGDGVSLDDTLVHYGVQFAEGKESKPIERRRPSIIYPPQQGQMMNQRSSNAVQQQE
ncbi:MAG: DUF6569 family protein [Thermoguttaceae bacterium]|jgi:hypothetical protein